MLFRSRSILLLDAQVQVTAVLSTCQNSDCLTSDAIPGGTLAQVKPQRTTQPDHPLTSPPKPGSTTHSKNMLYIFLIFNSLFNKNGLDHPAKHARLAQSVERETLTSTRSQGCGFDPRIGLFLYYIMIEKCYLFFCSLFEGLSLSLGLFVA